MRDKLFENSEIILYYDTISEKWYVENNEKGISYDLTLTNNLSCFLQLFYENPFTFFPNLSQKAKVYDLNERILNTLPFKTSIIFCIENKLLFWLELSLKWLEFINIDDELNKALKSVIKDSNFPQNIRHKLIKVIKK